jgi:hypothetical protein
MKGGLELEQNTSINNSQAWFKSVFFYLIAAILLQILVAPLLQPYIRLRILLDILSSITIIIAMFAASRKKRHIALAVILALPMLLSLWAKYFLVSEGIVVLGKFFGIAFLGFVIVQVSKFIYRSEAVTKDLIFAAIVVYLLMAVMWELIYMLLELLQPGAFNIPDRLVNGHPQVFLYFSLVTITTLGYGDITPVTEIATALSTLESLVGQIYLVVVVAWLVGMHVSQKSK